MTPRSMICFGLLAAAVIPSAFAGKPVPPPTEINVTTTIEDQAGSTLYLFRSDLQGGTNTTTYGGGVGLAAGEGWDLGLFNQSVRKVWITLNAVNGSTPPAPSGLYSQNVQVYSWCFDAAGNRVGFLSIPATASQNHCILGMVFGTAKDKYKLAMGQFAPTSGWVTVTCQASQSSGACSSWTITPNMIDANATIANLYKYGPSGNLAFLGQYYLTFRIDVTYP